MKLLLKADSHVSEARVVYREPRTNHYLLLTIIFMTVFIRGAPVDDNTASECICMVLTFYNCTEYEANEGISKRYPKNTSSCDIKGWIV